MGQVVLEEYYGRVSDTNAHIVEYASIKQGRTEGIQDYMQRLVHLAESAYMGADGENHVVTKQLVEIFIGDPRKRDIKMYHKT